MDSATGPLNDGRGLTEPVQQRQSDAGPQGLVSLLYLVYQQRALLDNPEPKGGIVEGQVLHRTFLTLLSFMVLFLTAGTGNGSTYRMIPSIFRTERVREVAEDESARAQAARLRQKEGSFVLGFAGAIGAYGGFLIPQAYKYSMGATGGSQTALITFVAFYLTCIAVTWFFYYRKNAEIAC